jgi:hypothetical protein
LLTIFRWRKRPCPPVAVLPDFEAPDWFEKFLDGVLDDEASKVAKSAAGIEGGTYLHLLASQLKSCGASPEIVGRVRCFADYLWGELRPVDDPDVQPLAAVAAE